MVMDPLLELSFHRLGYPIKFHVPQIEEFTTYDAWLGTQAHFVGRGEPTDDDACWGGSGSLVDY